MAYWPFYANYQAQVGQGGETGQGVSSLGARRQPAERVGQVVAAIPVVAFGYAVMLWRDTQRVARCIGREERGG